MKALILLIVITTIGMIILHYVRKRNLKKFFILIGTFGLILSLAVMGNITRQILPLFIAHLILLMMSWGGFLLYLFKDRYFWWIIFSPLLTIGLFLLMEGLSGSGHEHTLPALF